VPLPKKSNTIWCWTFLYGTGLEELYAARMSAAADGLTEANLSLLSKVGIFPCLLIKLCDLICVTYILQPAKEKHTDGMEMKQ